MANAWSNLPYLRGLIVNTTCQIVRQYSIGKRLCGTVYFSLSINTMHLIIFLCYLTVHLLLIFVDKAVNLSSVF